MKNNFIFGLILIMATWVGVGGSPIQALIHHDQILTKTDYIPNEYISKRRGTYVRYQHLAILKRKSDHEYVYCLQPDVLIDKDAIYSGYDTNYPVISNLTNDQWHRVSKLAYYGYGYQTATHNHTAKKWYAITQFMIWHSVPSEYDDIYFTDKLNGKKIMKYVSEIQEMESLLNSHDLKPQFGMPHVRMALNERKTLEDFNQVLNKYRIVNHNQMIGINQDGNYLNITALGVGSATIEFQKDHNRFQRKRLVYVEPQTQNIMYAGDLEPITAALELEVVGGKVSIQKKDADTGLAQAQGGATLAGALFGVYDENGSKIMVLQTDSHGNATSSYLPKLGKYYLQEEKAAQGYELNPKKYEFEVTDNNLNPIIEVSEQVIKANLRIKKIDQETNTCTNLIEGAVYEILDYNGNLVTEVTIGNDCTAMTPKLAYGRYKVVEKKAPTGYKLNQEIYEVNIQDQTTLNLVCRDEIIKGKIKIKKYDLETNLDLTLSPATLVGTKFVIKDEANQVVDTLIIDQSKTATSKLLKYGKYRVEEVAGSRGYLTNNQIKDQMIIEAKTYEIEYYNQVITNQIHILKQYGYIDEDTTFLEAEKNIKFEIYNSSSQKYGEIITDLNGQALIEMPYGTWRFHQVNTTPGYEKIPDFIVVVDEHSLVNQYYSILNNAITAYLKVIKTDVDTGENIAPAKTTFKIFNLDTNQWVIQSVGGKLINQFETDENGIMMTPLKLRSGNYRLDEIESPPGYLINDRGLEFTIDNQTQYSVTNQGLVVTLVCQNQAIRGQLKIQKTGESLNSGVYLKGVEFALYAAEDITSPGGNYLYYQKGTLVQILTTDETGITFSKILPLGKYYLIETKTGGDYTLNKVPFYFELQAIDNKTPLVFKFYQNTNTLKRGQIKINKLEASTGFGVPNAQIELYTINDELIFSGVTDEFGVLVVSNLPLGKYYVKEKKAPIGYVLINEKKTVELQHEGEIKNLYLSNERIKSIVQLRKTNELNEALAGAVIGIFDLEDNLVWEGITDDQGILEVELKYGKYYYRELSAPKHYILNPKKNYFEVSKNGMLILAELTNQPIKIKVPNTYTRVLNINKIIITLISLGISYLIFRKNKFFWLGSILLGIGLILGSENYPDQKHLNKNKTNQPKTILNQKLGKSPSARELIADKTNNYIGILEIPNIKLKKGFWAPTDSRNNVNYNIQLLKESDLPDAKNGMVILAGHSGTGRRAFFKDLFKLKKNDNVYIHYNHQNYCYQIRKRYLEPKRGEITIYRPPNQAIIVLTTCSRTKGEQLILIGELIAKNK